MRGKAKGPAVRRGRLGLGTGLVVGIKVHREDLTAGAEQHEPPTAARHTVKHHREVVERNALSREVVLMRRLVGLEWLQLLHFGAVGWGVGHWLLPYLAR